MTDQIAKSRHSRDVFFNPPAFLPLRELLDGGDIDRPVVKVPPQVRHVLVDELPVQ